MAAVGKWVQVSCLKLNPDKAKLIIEGWESNELGILNWLVRELVN